MTNTEDIKSKVELVAVLAEGLVITDKRSWLAGMEQRGGTVGQVTDITGMWPGWTHLVKVLWAGANGPYTVYAVRM